MELAYLEARARRHRELAAAATHDAALRAHLELAEAYEARGEQLRRGDLASTHAAEHCQGC